MSWTLMYYQAAANYETIRNRFDLFMDGLKIHYAGEFASDYDWSAISDDLWFACTRDEGGFWVFEEPDNDLLVSVLQAHDRG